MRCAAARTWRSPASESSPCRTALPARASTPGTRPSACRFQPRACRSSRPAASSRPLSRAAEAWASRVCLLQAFGGRATGPRFMIGIRIMFGDRVAEAVEHKRTQLVVGLDPRPDRLPVEVRGDIERFCSGIIDAVAPHAVAVKPQLAFFEALGVDGLTAFEQVCEYARSAGLLVIVDAKRGDIGSTARAYADAYLEPRAEGMPPVGDALTVNPYLGRDSVDPYLAACRRHGGGIFCVVKTSNAGGAEVQDLALSDGRPVWQHVALLVAEWGAEIVGERGPSARHVACCQGPSSCCRAWVPRAQLRPTSPARSRAARPVRSSTSRAQ